MATKDEVELRDMEAFLERNAAKLAELQAEMVRLAAAVSRREELEAEVARLRALISRRGSTLPGRLSVSRIEKLIKEGKVGAYGDGGNLWLQITNGGRAVSWLLRWKLHGRGDNMGLGSYKDVGLEEAREKALHYRRLLRRGKNPKAERDNARLDEQIAAGRAKTVSQVANEYFEAKIARKSASWQELTQRILTKHVHKKIGDMPIEKVTRGIILEKVGLAELWVKQFPTAEKLQNHLDRMFRLAISQGDYHDKNPAAWEDLQHVLPSRDDVHRTKHHASIPYSKVGQFLKRLRAYKYSPKGRGGSAIRYSPQALSGAPLEQRPIITLYLEFVILTGVRIGEVRYAQWKEFNLSSMVWTVPWQHLKMGRKHRTDRPVPITKPMLAVLKEAQRRRTDQSPDAIVFPARHDGRSFAAANLSVWLDTSAFRWETKVTPHGFRSTLRDWCRANKYPSEWWDIQADHVINSGDKTSQSYGHDKLLEDRRVMMEAWGEYCSQPAPEPQSADVVKLSEKRKRRSA